MLEDMQPPATGVYVRISSDTTGEGLGVARQKADCLALAERNGWPVAQVYVDNDVSAFSGKVRPAYASMLADVESGRIGAVVAWHGDRLQRSPLELEGFISLVEATGCIVATVQSGEIDLTTPSGRLHARTWGGFARYESELKSARIRSKLAQNAEAGKHHGGSRPFGWEDDRIALKPAEAEVVRLAADRLLTGHSIKAIVRELNAGDVPPAGTAKRPGTVWRDITVRGMLLRCRNAGLRRHHDATTEVAGKWEPILDRATWDQVRLILTDPSRRTAPGSAGRKHLLSAGIALCGLCGGPMRSAKGRAYKGVSKPIYRCKASSCLTRDMAALDAYVAGIVCARLSRPDAVHLLRPDTESAAVIRARAQVDELRGRLEVAAADYADGAIDAAQMRTITARLRPRIEAAERVIPAPAPKVSAVAQLVGVGDAERVWAGLDVSVRRQVLDAVMSVVVHPTRRGPGFREDDIEIRWR